MEQDEKIPEKKETKPKGSTMKDFFTKKEKANSKKGSEDSAVKEATQNQVQDSTVSEPTTKVISSKEMQF